MQKTVRVTLFGGPAGLSMEYDLPSPPGARMPMAITRECFANGENQVAVFVNDGDQLSYYFSHLRKLIPEKRKRRGG